MPLMGTFAGASARGLRRNRVNGNDANTVLLLHCNGTDASTSFPDASSIGHTVSAFGNAQVDTAQFKFGGASLLLDGTGDYLTVPDTGNHFDFGSGDFTIDFWFRPTSSVTGGLFTKKAAAADFGPFAVNQMNTNTLRTNFSSNGTTWNIANAVDRGTLVNGTWTHLAWVRSGSAFMFFQDGVKGTDIASSASALIANGAAFVIGANGATSPSVYAQAHIDAFRVSNVARWTTDFTVPNGQYD